MSEYGPTGAPPFAADELQAARDDITLAVSKALWRIQKHHQAHATGPTGFGPTGPSGGHPWHSTARKRA